MTAAQPGTMLRFHVGVLAGRDQALDERDYLIGVLTAAGAKLVLTNDGTEVLLTLNPADRPAPGLRDRLTAHVAALRADAETLRAAAQGRTTALGGDPDWHAAGDLEMRADELDALLATTGQPDPPPEPRGGGEPGEPDARAEYAALCAQYEPDGQCTASSWQTKDSHRPYGPGGYNRCTLPADPPHGKHTDDFGYVFLFNPDGRPRVRVLRGIGGAPQEPDGEEGGR